MFAIELVEGKDRPPESGAPKFDSVGKTGGLLLRMLQCYFHTGRYVVLDSGFCVLKAIFVLYEKGLYAGTLIKKRRYWSTLVPSDVIDSQFADKRTGDTMESLKANSMETLIGCEA
jgi:hypothetical protein